ncbi:MAG: hypothetical protein ACR2NY_03765 [Alphaproteobacteria bacterium]
MDKLLADVVKDYSLGKSNFIKKLNTYSKENLNKILSDIITHYFNDKNSSYLREYITAIMAGYTPSNAKLGYNGYKTNGGEITACEIKPANCLSNSSQIRKLRGSGNFSDYTWARFAKDKKANPMILISGFVDGILVFILEIPFASKGICDRLERQLKRILPNGDMPRNYVRSAQFTYKDYLNNAKKKYLTNDINKFKNYFTKKFFDELIKK